MQLASSGGKVEVDKLLIQKVFNFEIWLDLINNSHYIRMYMLT